MKLSDALSMIKGGEKTASVAPLAAASRGYSSSTSDAAERLKLALKEATSDSGATKAASAGSPINDLTKIATDLSRAEHEALSKEAQLYGAAVCDGFMARAAQYKHAAEQVAPYAHAQDPYAYSKVASYEGGSFEKFAAENPSIVKEAAELGYATTTAQLTKLAEDAYAKGWNDTVAQIHKAACDSFVSGFSNGETLISAALQAQGRR